METCDILSQMKPKFMEERITVILYFHMLHIEGRGGVQDYRRETINRQEKGQ